MKGRVLENPDRSMSPSAAAHCPRGGRSDGRPANPAKTSSSFPFTQAERGPRLAASSAMVDAARTGAKGRSFAISDVAGRISGGSQRGRWEASTARSNTVCRSASHLANDGKRRADQGLSLTSSNPASRSPLDDLGEQPNGDRRLCGSHHAEHVEETNPIGFAQHRENPWPASNTAALFSTVTPSLAASFKAAT